MVDWMKVIRLLLFGIPFCVSYFLQPRLDAENKDEIASQCIETIDFERNWAKFAQAEELFQATLYEKAIEQYAALLHQAESQIDFTSNLQAVEFRAILRVRLAQAYFLSGEFARAKLYFEQSDREAVASGFFSEELLEQSSYYEAVCCRYLKDYRRALNIIKTRQSKDPAFFENELQFELGLNYFFLGEMPAAKEALLLVEKHHLAEPICSLVQIYLAKLYIYEGSLEEASLRLNNLRSVVGSQSDLRYELAFLKGRIAYRQKKYQQAIECFEAALPKLDAAEEDWVTETLYCMGGCHLQMAKNSHLTPEEQRRHFDQAESCFLKLVGDQAAERYLLALASCYLNRGICLKERLALKKAADLTMDREAFKTPEAKTYAALLQAESVLHHLFEGPESAGVKTAEKLFLEAAKGFSESYLYYSEFDQGRASKAFKNQIVAYQRCNSIDSLQTALIQLQKNLDASNANFQRDELTLLYGIAACRLAEASGLELDQAAKEGLESALVENPHGVFADACLNLLGCYFFRQGRYEQAEAYFSRLVQTFPQSDHASSALFWSCLCLEKQKKSNAQIQEYKRKLFENYPESPYAAWAYFHYYTYRQYLQGDREAARHLKAFKIKFPDSPLIIAAYYLRGLDYKRELKSPEGRAIRKKNLVKAIDLFYKSQTHFDELNLRGKISKEQKPFYTALRYRAFLERALANQSVAEESQLTKQKIYRQYAKELFTQINSEFADGGHPLAGCLLAQHPFPDLYQESLYLLVKNLIGSKDYKAANQLIQSILEKYETLKITKGYYLSRLYYEQAAVALHQGDVERALELFKQAEASDQGLFLSVDQKLDLWIQQSQCYKLLNQADLAMLILSKVINDNTVSSLRVKAMFLRAEIYTLQGRHELARRQLEATAKKGGEWGVKAKQQLERQYGN